MEYDRGDSFPFDLEANETPFGFKKIYLCVVQLCYKNKVRIADKN